MLMSSIPEDGGDEATKDMAVRISVIENKIKGITKSLQKEATTLQLKKRDLFEGPRTDRGTVLSFLEDKRLLELVTRYVVMDDLAIPQNQEEYMWLHPNQCRSPSLLPIASTTTRLHPLQNTPP